MKLISFNVNGLRSIISKDKNGNKLERQEAKGNPNVLQYLVNQYDPDVICLQETRCPDDCKTTLDFPFQFILSSKTKKGYSGVAIFSKIQPIKVYETFPHNEEGRLLCVEFPSFFLMNGYVPNSKRDLLRLEYRIGTWEVEVRNYISIFQQKKPVVYCADFNVAPTALDIYTTKGNEKAPGYTIEERNAFSTLLQECDMIDTYRYLHPNEIKYTWFSNFGKAYENNKGWRIDHFLVNKNMKNNIKKSEILSEVRGSDHIPILLELDIDI